MNITEKRTPGKLTFLKQQKNAFQLIINPRYLTPPGDSHC